MWMEIVEIWQNLEKTQILVFFPHYMWAEKNYVMKPYDAMYHTEIHETKIQEIRIFTYIQTKDNFW